MALLTREMMNQYAQSVSGGNTPDNLLKRDIPDFIGIVSRTDTPVAKAVKIGKESDTLKIEWGETDITPRAVKNTAAVADAVTLNITIADWKAIQQYDILRFKDNGEMVRVVVKPTSSTVALQARGFAGTTAASHLINTDIQILGPAVPEGVATPESPFQQGDVDYNYHQIFEYSWSYTHRGRVTPTYETLGDRFKEELRRKMIEAAMDLENFLIYGLRNQGDASGANASTFGGIRQFTTQNVIPVGGTALTLRHILDELQLQYMKVGQNNMSKTIWGNMFSKRIFNSFFNASRRSTATDAKLGLTLDTIQTDFGDVKFVTHYNWPDAELHFLNIDDISRHAYKGGNWATGVFSTDGWYDRGYLRGDFGMRLPAPARRGAITGFSTSPASYPDLDAIISNAA